MSSVDGMYRIILEQQAEDRALAAHSHLVAEAAHARTPRRHVRMALGSAFIRFGNRLAPQTAPVLRGTPRLASSQEH